MVDCKINIELIFVCEMPKYLINLISFRKSCAVSKEITNNKITDIQKIIVVSAYTICLLISILSIDFLNTIVGVIACTPWIFEYSETTSDWFLRDLVLINKEVIPKSSWLCSVCTSLFSVSVFVWFSTAWPCDSQIVFIWVNTILS